MRSRTLRRGTMLPALAICTTGLFGMVAVSADVGMIYTARAEAQRAADAAALAGLTAWLEQPDNPDRAREIAAEYAAMNTVRGTPVTLEASDMTLSLGLDTAFVVRVERTSERGNAIPTLFAGFIGFDFLDVEAEAAASPSPSGRARCFRPFLVVDAWDDADADGEYDSGEYYAPLETGYGSDWRSDGYDRDLGRQITIYGTGDSGGGMYNSSWYGLYSVTGEPGAARIREQIESEQCVQTPIEVGQIVENEPGAKNGALNSSIDDLVGYDAAAYWDSSSGTVAGSVYGADWLQSPRIGRIALFDPADMPRPGRQEIEVSNFITVFIEGWDENGNVTARVLPTVAEAAECSGAGECAAFAYFSRLVR